MSLLRVCRSSGRGPQFEMIRLLMTDTLWPAMVATFGYADFGEFKGVVLELSRAPAPIIATCI